MDCSQVEELLSEYLDDTLDPSARRQIDQHLSTCKTCSAELEEMQSYLRAMNSLDKIRAPADFLAKIHSRIEQPTFWRNLLERIFTPLRIKVPLELAGVLIAAVLVVFTYQLTLLERERPVAPHISEAPQPAVPQHATKSAQQNDLDKSERKPQLPAAAPAEGLETIELSLILRKDLQQYVKKSSAESSLTVAAPEQELSRSRPPDVGEAHQQQSKPPKRKATRAAGAHEKAGDSDLDASKASLDEKSSSARYLNPFSIISGYTHKAGGKVSSFENRTGTDELKFVIVEIPTSNYPAFVNDLRQIGEVNLLENTAAIMKGPEIVRLRINLANASQTK